MVVICMLVLRIIAALSPKASSENSPCWKAFLNDLPAVKGINHQPAFWQYLESVFILVKSILSHTGSTRFDRFPFHTDCQELLAGSRRGAALCGAGEPRGRSWWQRWGGRQGRWHVESGCTCTIRPTSLLVSTSATLWSAQWGAESQWNVLPRYFKILPY